MMSSADQDPQVVITLDDITANVEEKVRHYLSYPKVDEQGLKLVVYGDKEHVTQGMWNSMFSEDLPDVYIVGRFPLIPIPTNFTPERYEHYERQLREHVASCVEKEDLICGLYNLAVPKQDPRMHLVLANRQLKRSELIETAEEGMGNRGSHLDPRFISIESLRNLLSSLLDFDPSCSVQEVSPSTSASVDY